MKRTCLALLIATLAGGISGCFYPPTTQPPPPKKTRATIGVPYDLTWDAVHQVISKNDFKLQGDNPDHGIIEAQTHSFTLADADCGKSRSIGSPYDAEPEPGSSAVYNFRLEPAGTQATTVSVNATYSTPLHVPFHPTVEFYCVSRGVREARLLDEIEVAARAERRPTETMAPAPEQPQILTPGRPTLLKPDILKKPEIH